MEINIILCFLMGLNLSLVVSADTDRENIVISNTGRNKVYELSTKKPANEKRKLTLAQLRRKTRTPEILLQSADEHSDWGNSEENDPIKDNNRLILELEKRISHSIQKHGLTTEESGLLKYGNYRIDWWKRDRHLQRMKERLIAELEMQPKLNQRLRMLGWRGTFEKSPRIKDVIGENAGKKTSSDSMAMTPDYGVIDVNSSEIVASSESENVIFNHSSRQGLKSDWLLQLIPPVVQQLRMGMMSAADQRTFNRIFAKSLWQLLKLEASKIPGETMDWELAMFLLNGEL